MHSCFATSEGPDEMVEVVRGVQRLFDRIEAAPAVTVAEIGATAMGGGMELALACDVRVAAFEAKLGLTEIRLGLLPAGGGTQRLTRLCGRGTASRLILSGEVVTGEEAARLGLVQWACPRAQLGDLTKEVIGRFAASPRTAIALNKHCIALEGVPDRVGFAEEITATRRLYDDPESRRRVKEFMSKSKPT
jgi:enoyl-CoA hydratase/carnithine racemase